MPETFVPLAAWLRPPAAPPPALEETRSEEEPALPADEMGARVRRLRAAVIEALEAPDRGAFERLRSYADELLERWAQ